jgi:hypothetical protein
LGNFHLTTYSGGFNRLPASVLKQAWREANARFGHGIERPGFKVGIAGTRQHPGMMLVGHDEKDVGLLRSLQAGRYCN